MVCWEQGKGRDGNCGLWPLVAQVTQRGKGTAEMGKNQIWLEGKDLLRVKYASTWLLACCFLKIL